MNLLGITWNPGDGIDLGFYTIPVYSLMFMISFVCGWFIMKRIYQNEGESVDKLDSLFVYMVISILIGARLGHVLFYQSELIFEDPLAVLFPISTEGGFKFTGFRGLASHGAAIGVIVAMFIYSKKVIKKPVLWILDRIVIPVALGAIFVRFGNFMNSEIIGKPTTADFPLAVRFIKNYYSPREITRITGIEEPSKAYDALVSDPQFAEYLDKVPWSHPAQLYESFGYLILFILLWFVYWKTDKKNNRGYIFGLFLVVLWGVRFIVEFFKKSQGGFQDWAMLENTLTTGQYLSIPFIFIGIYFMYKSAQKQN